VSRVDVRGIRREQIVDAAERLVAERGWAGTTFADICREAGISNGVLTYHFSDKGDLLMALFERGMERWKANAEMMARDVLTPRERAAVAVQVATQRIETEPEYFRLLLHYMCEATHRPEMAAQLKEVFSRIRGHIATKLAEDAGAGIPITRDPAVAAAVLQTVILGYSLGRVALGLQPSEEELIDLLANYLSAPLDRHSKE